MDTTETALAKDDLSGVQMFGTQNPVIPAYVHIVSVRVDLTSDIATVLMEVIGDTFLETCPNPGLCLEFTKKNPYLGDLNVRMKSGDMRAQPILSFWGCGLTGTNKDSFFTISLRNINGVPIEKNMALLRHLLINLGNKKIKYEIW